MGLWQDRHAATIDLDRFRGHDQYLEQAPSYDYDGMVAFLRNAGWPDRYFVEDDAFGCVTAQVNGVTVSRDLLDSMAELEFLIKATPLTERFPTRILDIGAGYGRFAHRFAVYEPNAVIVCTDPIAVSRACCKKYLEYRGVWNCTVAAPEHVLGVFDLAVNIHSWSECTLDEVAWWIDWLWAHNVPRLFIVPHTPTLGTWSPDHGGGNGPSFRPELEKRGYRIVSEWGGPACTPRTYQLWGLR